MRSATVAIENYSQPLSGRPLGSPPDTLLPIFLRFLVFIDESHVTVSQIQGMYFGDAARKKTIDYGFVCSAADNRPLNFKEFWSVPQTIFVSATPSV